MSPPLPSTTALPESDASAADIDQFATTLSNIKSKNVRPDLLASIISHYASKWLPEFSSDSGSGSNSVSSPVSSTASWLKKRYFVENLINVLPPEKDSMPCDFLLKLLRSASMVKAGMAYTADVEARVAYQLDRATLKDVMIPAFSHTCGTLLDVGLVVRLVTMFLASEEAMRSQAAMVKVAKLVDSYLAEVGMDARLTVAEFEQLATAMPGHARATDDGLYRAVDTYIKAHPTTTKQEKKALTRLIDPRKLTPEASFHVVHNDRLPVRSVLQVLLTKQCMPNMVTESGGDVQSPSLALKAPGQCQSKREVLAQQHEMRKLKEDMGRLESQCRALQAQVDRLGMERKKKRGIFKWSSFLFRSNESTNKSVDDYEFGREYQTPSNGRKARTPHGKGTPSKWRHSLS